MNLIRDMLAQEEHTLSDDGSHGYLVKRLDRIESTVAMIENAMLQAQEEGETRHADLLHHLDDLKTEVLENNKILKKLRDRGWFACCAKKECVFIVIILGLIAWIYFLQRFNFV